MSNYEGMNKRHKEREEDVSKTLPIQRDTHSVQTETVPLQGEKTEYYDVRQGIQTRDICMNYLKWR